MKPLLTASEHGTVRIAKCYLPLSSFAVGAYADPAHLLAPRRVAERLLASGRKDPQPVYLSRSLVTHTRNHENPLRNELEFEARLQRHGVRIVHMQHHSPAEQIEIINAHDIFIAPWGSAQHNLVFRLDSRDLKTFVIFAGFAPRNCMLVDLIVGGAPHYLMTMVKPPDFETARQFEIDIDATLDYLRRCGAV